MHLKQSLRSRGHRQSTHTNTGVAASRKSKGWCGTRDTAPINHHTWRRDERAKRGRILATTNGCDDACPRPAVVAIPKPMQDSLEEHKKNNKPSQVKWARANLAGHHYSRACKARHVTAQSILDHFPLHFAGHRLAEGQRSQEKDSALAIPSTR
jgi:hypothetical protein